MPLYDYTCTECRKPFEHLARRMDEPAPPCPHCGSKKTVKGLSAFAVGSGAGKSSTPLPVGGGCCPCGKNAGSCSMG